MKVKILESGTMGDLENKINTISKKTIVFSQAPRGQNGQINFVPIYFAGELRGDSIVYKSYFSIYH